MVKKKAELKVAPPTWTPLTMFQTISWVHVVPHLGYVTIQISYIISYIYMIYKYIYAIVQIV